MRLRTRTARNRYRSGTGFLAIAVRQRQKFRRWLCGCRTLAKSHYQRLLAMPPAAGVDRCATGRHGGSPGALSRFSSWAPRPAATGGFWSSAPHALTRTYVGVSDVCRTSDRPTRVGGARGAVRLLRSRTRWMVHPQWKDAGQRLQLGKGLVKQRSGSREYPAWRGPAVSGAWSG